MARKKKKKKKSGASSAPTASTAPSSSSAEAEEAAAVDPPPEVSAASSDDVPDAPAPAAQSSEPLEESIAATDEDSPEPAPAAKPKSKSKAAEPASPSLPKAESARVFEMAEVPAKDRDHPAAARFVKGYECFLLGDYPAARELLEPIGSGQVDAPASYRKAVERLLSFTGIDNQSLIFGAGLLVFFLIIVWLVY